MNRRNFLRSLVGGVAATAAVRTWPFRVYSFPSEVVTPPFMVHVSEVGVFDETNAITLANLRDDILYDTFFVDTPWLSKLKRRESIKGMLV